MEPSYRKCSWDSWEVGCHHKGTLDLFGALFGPACSLIYAFLCKYTLFCSVADQLSVYGS